MDRILIIDDEEDIRIALQRVLSREGYSIDLSDSVANAIELIEAGNTYSIIISDVLMKGMSGYRFYKICIRSTY